MAARRAHQPLDRSEPQPFTNPGGAPRLRDISYHSARSIEELDHADAALDRDARRLHEQLANRYLATAARLHNRELCSLVAGCVD